MRQFIVNTIWLLVMIALSGLVYVRLAPDNPAEIHLMPPAGASVDQPVIGPGSALFVAEFNLPPQDLWSHIQQLALNTPRTKQLAGSPEEGMVSYVSRSFLFGFPDDITVLVQPDEAGSRVVMFSRSRFGYSDFGTNEARLRDWLAALTAAIDAAPP